MNIYIEPIIKLHYNLDNVKCNAMFDFQLSLEDI